MSTIFDKFTLDGIYYHKSGNIYYADNMTIREKISLKEYKQAMMDKLIQN